MKTRSGLSLIPEKEVQANGIRLLQSMGWLVKRRNVGGRHWTDRRGRDRYQAFADPGDSDTYGIMPDGRHFECEFKRYGERPTIEQATWLHEANRYAPAFWVDSVQVLAKVARHLQAGGRIQYLTGFRIYRIDGRDVPGPNDQYDLI